MAKSQTQDQKVLNAADILGADDLHKELVPVPEWGGSVYVRGLTGIERDTFEVTLVKARNGEPDKFGARAQFAAIAIVKEDGSPMFSKGDIEALSRKNSRALERVFDAGLRLSGMTSTEVEKLEGNSEGEG